MSLISDTHRGLIYAGDTPLACSITVEQTGPLQLTVRAGSFTTTGQAKIAPYDPVVHGPQITAGKVERLLDGKRVRCWLTRADGSFVQKPETVVLLTDRVLDLVPDPLGPIEYQAELWIDATGEVDVLLRSRLGRGRWSMAPSGWRKIIDIILPFIVPPGTLDLSALSIYVWSVRAGFPPGTTASDWTVQAG